jgi:hypothetical protein
MMWVIGYAFLAKVQTYGRENPAIFPRLDTVTIPDSFARFIQSAQFGCDNY